MVVFGVRLKATGLQVLLEELSLLVLHEQCICSMLQLRSFSDF
jgi:hypothetical protein